MNRFSSLLLLLFSSQLFSSDESFILLTDEKIVELGPNIDKPMTPCSTFKIALSLIGFDSKILQDESSPTWLFQEGYDDFLEVWKSPQTPKSWMKYSCIWYSNVLALQLGWEGLRDYLTLLEYGNQDVSGCLQTVWVNSTLQISPRDQALFLQRMLQGELPISDYAVQMTRSIAFVEELPDGWKLFGKTGWGGRSQDLEIGWFIGWIEKESQTFPFAYNIRGKEIDLGQRIPRAKQLLSESDLMSRQ